MGAGIPTDVRCCAGLGAGVVPPLLTASRRLNSIDESGRFTRVVSALQNEKTPNSTQLVNVGGLLAYKTDRLPVCLFEACAMGRALSANEHAMGNNGRLFMVPASLRDQRTQQEKDLELRSTCESVPTCETVRSLEVFNGSRLYLFWDVRLCGVKPQLPRAREAL